MRIRPATKNSIAKRNTNTRAEIDSMLSSPNRHWTWGTERRSRLSAPRWRVASGGLTRLQTVWLRGLPGPTELDPTSDMALRSAFLGSARAIFPYHAEPSDI